MTKVAIIVLNWNGAPDTIECLKSIEKLTSSNLHLHTFVIDNDSSDDSVKEITSFVKQKKSITIIENKKNLGFAGGNNVGIRKALEEGFDYLFVLNNDTILHEDCMTELVLASQTYTDGGLFTPKIYFAKGFEFHKDRYQKESLGHVIWSAGGDMDWNNVYGSNHGVDQVDIGQFNMHYATTFATGAALFGPAETFKKIGMFDEKYFLYLEDLDLSIRVQKKHKSIIYVPDAIVWHKVSQSSGIGSGLNDYYITRNRLMFGMRYASLRTKFALARESIRMYFSGRQWQKIGVKDYYLGNLGKGSYTS
jgi:GT2 family glycosyltransferase